MKTRQYTNPGEAFKIMNRATDIQTSYETQFLGKEITRVDVHFDGDKPLAASVHYKTRTCIGIESIDLSKKLL